MTHFLFWGCLKNSTHRAIFWIEKINVKKGEKQMEIPFTLEEVASWEMTDEISCPILGCDTNHRTIVRKNLDENAEIKEVWAMEDDLDSNIMGVYAYFYKNKDGEMCAVKYCATHQMLETMIINENFLR